MSAKASFASELNHCNFLKYIVCSLDSASLPALELQLQTQKISALAFILKASSQFINILFYTWILHSIWRSLNQNEEKIYSEYTKRSYTEAKRSDWTAGRTLNQVNLFINLLIYFTEECFIPWIWCPFSVTFVFFMQLRRI